MQQYLSEFTELQPDELGATLDDLQEMLTHFSPREALARFRPLLEQPVRYTKIDQLSFPFEADLYLLSSLDS